MGSKWFRVRMRLAWPRWSGSDMAKPCPFLSSSPIWLETQSRWVCDPAVGTGCFPLPFITNANGIHFPWPWELLKRREKSENLQKGIVNSVEKKQSTKTLRRKLVKLTHTHQVVWHSCLDFLERPSNLRTGSKPVRPRQTDRCVQQQIRNWTYLLSTTPDETAPQPPVINPQTAAHYW